MFISHHTDDIPTLKACAATCFRWYHIATPHIYRTLVLQKWHIDVLNEYQNNRTSPLPSLLELGFLALVKNLEFKREMLVDRWVAAAIFDSRSIPYFRAMVNLQELKIADLDFAKFWAGFEKYFGHFSPTLRSVALSRPNGTRRELIDFFRLFPKLDDIEISCYDARRMSFEAPEDQIVPVTGGLRGRLTLDTFGEEELLKDMIVAFGGMRFTSMDLRDVLRGMPLLLVACGGTLETLRISMDDIPHPCKAFDFSVHFPDIRTHSFSQVYPRYFSCNTALRTIEFPMPPTFDPSRGYTRRIERLLSAITSPTFSEIVIIFSGRDVYRPSETLASIVREFCKVKKFKVAFCLETQGYSRAENLRMLTLETERAAAAGLYDFLPHPPSVFACTMRKYL